MVPVYGQIIIGCLILAVIEHYTMDNTYGWMQAYGCTGCVRERGTIVSVWARPGMPAFGGKYVTVWNGWDGHALSAAIIACFSRKREATTSGETPDSKCSMVPPIVKLWPAKVERFGDVMYFLQESRNIFLTGRKVEPSGARAEKRGRLPEYHG
jgi:hypothetical protein